MSTPTASKLHRPTLVIGIALFALAAITWNDAATMTIRASYGMGADAASYFVAVFLGALGIGHLVSAFRWQTDPSHSDWKAVGWVSLGLFSLFGALWFQFGFVLGSSLLFCFSARAFGRRRILTDLLIGFALATAIFLLFNKLLTLALPMGPFERLL